MKSHSIAIIITPFFLLYFPISNAFDSIDLFALKTVTFASYERVAEIKIYHFS